MSSDWCSSRLISAAIVAQNQNGLGARSELISGENLTTTSKLNRWIFKFNVDGLLNWTAEYFNSISMVSLTNNSRRLLLEQPECRSIAKVSWDEVSTKYHIETTSKRISQTRIIGGTTLFRHTSPTVLPWELGRRKISMSLKTPSRWKIFYQYQVSNQSSSKSSPLSMHLWSISACDHLTKSEVI